MKKKRYIHRLQVEPPYHYNWGASSEDLARPFLFWVEGDAWHEAFFEFMGVRSGYIHP